MMNQIKFSELTKDQTIQIVDLNDYFGDGIPTISEPLTKEEFSDEHLKEIIEDMAEDGDDISIDTAFEYFSDDSGGGDSNKVYITVIDGAAHLVVA